MPKQKCLFAFADFQFLRYSENGKEITTDAMAVMYSKRNSQQSQNVLIDRENNISYDICEVGL